MARVPYQSASDLPEEYRELLVRPINLFRSLANSPELFRLFHQLGEWIRFDCEVDPRLRELAILQVGYQTESEYEFTHHVQISKQFGVTDDDIQALIDDTAGRPTALSDLDKAVLLAARELTADREVSDEVWAVLAAEFEPGRLVDLVAVIAFYNMVVRVLGGLQVDNEPEFARHLEQFPFGQA